MNLTIGISELVTFVSALILGIIWLIRLEGKVSYGETMQKELSGEIKDLRTKHEALDSRIVDKLSNVEKSLAKIEGRLSINKGQVE